MQESKQRGRIAKVFQRSPSKRLIASPKSNGTTDSSNGGGGKSSLLGGMNLSKSYRPHHDNKVTSKQPPEALLPRKAWEQQSDEYDELQT